MKKIKLYYLAIFFLIKVAIAPAQNDLSLSFGMNRSNIFFSSIDESILQYKTSYFVGIQNVFLKNNKFELSSELQYSNKGYNNVKFSDKATFKYLDAVHLMTYKPVKNIGFMLGLNTGFLLNETKVISNRRFDVGLVGGVSIGSGNIKIFSQFNYGLADHKLMYDFKNKSRNVNLQLGIRYVFYNMDKKNEKIVYPKAYELGLGTSNLSTFKAIFKQKIQLNKYVRYDASLIDFNISQILVDHAWRRLDLQLNAGFGIEKRKQIENIEILHGFMYRLGINYSSRQQFVASPFVGYLIGVQYNYKRKYNFGIELIPGLTFNITKSRYDFGELNANFKFINAPSFFLTYRLNNESDQQN